MFTLVMLEFAITPLPLASVQTWPGGGVARTTEYVPPLKAVTPNLYDPFDDTDSGSDSLLMSVRLPPERPDTVPPIEKAAGVLELELEEPPQPASCRVMRLSNTKPKSFTKSLLTCARSSRAILKTKSFRTATERTAIALNLSTRTPQELTWCSNSRQLGLPRGTIRV